MPADLRDTEEYRELLKLKRLQKAKDCRFSGMLVIFHNSYFNFTLPDRKSTKYTGYFVFF